MGDIIRFIAWASITLMASGAAVALIDPPEVATGTAVLVGILGGLRTLRAYSAVVAQWDESPAVSQLLLVPLRVGGLMISALGGALLLAGERRSSRAGLPLLIVGLLMAVIPETVWRAWWKQRPR